MRPLSLAGKPAASASMDAKMTWVMNAIDQIARYSQTENMSVSDVYTILNLNSPATRTLDVANPTLAQVAQVVGSVISDMKKRGVNNGQG